MKYLGITFLLSACVWGQTTSGVITGRVRAANGDQEIRWFNYWLKGEENGIMDEPPVRYFMMASARKGAFSPLNRWISAANWPPAETG